MVKWLKKSNGLKGKPEECRTAEEPLLAASETNRVSGILPPKFERETVEHFCLNEWAVHLDDVMLRRSGWHYYFRDAPSKAQQVAEWMAELLGWTAETLAEEIGRYERLVSRACEPAAS